MIVLILRRITMKKSIIVSLLALPLVLASCANGDAGSKSESEQPGTSQNEAGTSNDANNSNVPAESSSVAPEKTRTEKLVELFGLMATGASSTFVEPTTVSTYYLGENIGILDIYSDTAIENGAENGGVLIAKNYGVFKYGYDDDAEDITSLDVISPNTSLLASDLVITTKTLGTIGKDLTWTESARTHTFTTYDESFVTAVGGLLGYEKYISSYSTKKVAFKITEDGKTINNMELTLSGAASDSGLRDVTISNMRIEKVGSTVDLGIESFAKNPTGIRAATAWSQAELNFFTTNYNASFDLPYPTGASWATYEYVTQNGIFVWEDYKCGDKTTTYVAQLTAKGYILNQDESDATKGVYVYEKQIDETSRGAIRQVVMVMFEAADAQNPLYPYGTFTIASYVYRKTASGATGSAAVDDFYDVVDSEMSIMSPTTQAFPQIDVGNPISATYTDETEEEVYDLDYYIEAIDLVYGYLDAVYATRAEAQAVVSSIISACVAAGFTDASASSQADGVCYKTDGYDSDWDYQIQITMVITANDDGTYTLRIVLWHFGYYDWSYDW